MRGLGSCGLRSALLLLHNGQAPAGVVPYLMQRAVVALRWISEASAVGGCRNAGHIPHLAIVMVPQHSPPLNLQ